MDLRERFEQEALVHLDSMFNMALNLVRDRTEAEDLVQEAMLRAYRNFHQYKAGTNCRAWLLKILRNTFINRYRQIKSRPLEVDIEAIAEPSDHTGMNYGATEILDPKEELFKDLYDDEITSALNALPEEFREVLILSDVEELAYQEISEVLEIPLGTVRSRLSRAREMMRRQLLEYARQHGYTQDPG